MPRHDDSVSLRQMLDFAQAARRVSAGHSRPDLDTNETLQLALTRAVEVVGEAANRVSEPSRQRHNQIPWSQIVATRHRLIHGYDQIDFDVLWRIVHDELPPLIAQLESILARHPGRGA